MAMGEVFGNSDLVKLILRPSAEAINPMASAESILEEIRGNKTRREVSHLFAEIGKETLATLMVYFRLCMEAFERTVDVIYASLHLPSASLNWGQILKEAHWAETVFGLDLRLARGDYAAELHFMLDQFARRREPQTHDELADLLEKKCACCGKPCPLLATARAVVGSAYRPWIENRQAFSAFAMHPYRGNSFARIDNKRVMMGTIVPFTHQDHFFEVSFVYEYRHKLFGMRLHVYAQMTSEELRFARFMEGARNQPWYQENVRRIFELRDPHMFCEENNNERTMFVAHICMFEPRFADAKDWSVQSIFGLTRAEVLKTIRRGSAIQREKRLLSCCWRDFPLAGRP